MSLLKRTTHCFSCPDGELVQVPTCLARKLDVPITKPSNYDSLESFQKRALKAQAQSAFTGTVKHVCTTCGAKTYTDLGSGHHTYVRGLAN